MTEEKEPASLEDTVNYAKLSVSAKNPNHAIYALNGLLENQTDSVKKKLEPWVIPLGQDIAATGKIPEYGERALSNYQRPYLESLNESPISTLIDVAKAVGYEPEDFSDLVKPGETYKDVMGSEAVKNLRKKISNAEIDGEKPKLTKEEQKLLNTINVINMIHERIEKTIIHNYDNRAANDNIKKMNGDYKQKEEQEEQSQEQLQNAA